MIDIANIRMLFLYLNLDYDKTMTLVQIIRIQILIIYKWNKIIVLQNTTSKITWAQKYFS